MSAVELDPKVVEGRRRDREADGCKVELTSKVDPDILGGLVLQVGNMVLDASIRNSLKTSEGVAAKAA